MGSNGLSWVILRYTNTIHDGFVFSYIVTGSMYTQGQMLLFLSFPVRIRQLTFDRFNIEHL